MSSKNQADDIMKEIEQEINLKAEQPFIVVPGISNGCLALPQVPQMRFIRMLGSGCFGKVMLLTLGSVFEVEVKMHNTTQMDIEGVTKVSRRKSSGKISCPKVSIHDEGR